MLKVPVNCAKRADTASAGPQQQADPARATEHSLMITVRVHAYVQQAEQLLHVYQGLKALSVWREDGRLLGRGAGCRGCVSSEQEISQSMLIPVLASS